MVCGYVMKYQVNTLYFKMKKVVHEAFLFEIEDFFTSQMCDDFILWSEQQGYDEAKVQVNGTEIMMKNIRNNSRITFTDIALANRVWDQFKSYAVPLFANSEVIGLNEMFRFYKYEVGQKFKRHIDGSYVRNGSEASYFTLMIYLNDDFEGGHTTFDHYDIAPKKGSALVFYHGMKHCGEEIKSGIKYVLRTDIMYKLKK
jgi:prolyl 4-hydroxylase